MSDQPTSPSTSGESGARGTTAEHLHTAADICSNGGGRQTTALLVLTVKGYLDIPRFVFSNVGDDSEDPATLKYLREVAWDYATSNGIEMHEVGPARGITLRERLMTAPSGHETIPIRGENGMPFKRGCTSEWKVGEVEKWLAARGYSAERPATVAIGFSKDEYQRVNADKARSIQKRVYPLLHLEWKGGTGLDVAQCEQLIRSAGLPVPPKSSCYFCPFHKPAVWREMRRDRAELFEDSCHMEETMNAKRTADGKRPAYFSRFGRPLREAIAEADTPLFSDPTWDDEDYRCGDLCGT